MKTIHLTISGPEILMHRFPLETIDGLAKMTKEEQAEFSAYRDDDTGELFVPGINIQRCLISAATFSKGKGRASLKREVAACVSVSPMKVFLGTKEYEIDSRAVVVPATKGRIVRHRPMLKDWELTFEVEYDEILLSEKQVRKVVDDAGKRVGLLDFRPEKNGPFGKFVVNNWSNGKK